MADEEHGDSHEQKVKQEGTVINLVVKDQQGNEVHFKVKMHTKLEKVGAQARASREHIVAPPATRSAGSTHAGFACGWSSAFVT